MIERILAGDRAKWLALRQRDITASVVGALFGAHEFTTLYELWAIKSGRHRQAEEETPAMQRGRLLEPVAVQLLRERYPDWTITHNAAENVYFRDPDARLGGTPDVIATAPGRGKGVIQIKSVEASVFRRKWLDEEGNAEPPLWIALQATLEHYLTGAQWAAVAPLVIGHGLEMPLIEVPIIDGVVEAMKAKAAEFWRLVAAQEEPAPDYDRDGAIIDLIYAKGDEHHEIDLTADNRIPELLSDRAAARAVIAEHEKIVRQIDTEIKAKLGTAMVAHIAGGRKITWKPQKRAGSYTPPSNVRALRYPNEKDL